jgi:DHA2 family multidrug resistance protein
MVLAPRGLGTMAAMLTLGRIISRVDGRILIFTGLSLTALSLWQMAGWSPLMGMAPFITSGVIQGLGLGFIFMPLSVITFGTIEPHLRTDATGLYNLIRNLGSSLGVSVVATLLAQNIQINHAELAARITPFNPALSFLPLDTATQFGLAGIDAQVNAQAAMISYLNDFRLMMVMTLAVMPLLLLLRPPARLPTPAEPVVME